MHYDTSRRNLSIAELLNDESDAALIEIGRRFREYCSRFPDDLYKSDCDFDDIRSISLQEARERRLLEREINTLQKKMDEMIKERREHAQDIDQMILTLRGMKHYD